MEGDSTDSEPEHVIKQQQNQNQRRPERMQPDQANSERSQSMVSVSIESQPGYKRNQIVILIIALSLGFSTFPNLAISYFFKDTLHLDPAELSIFNSVINFIWILKPVFGFISDSYPIFGSHRRSYLCLFSVVSGLSWIAMGLWVSNLWQAILVKTLINISTNFCNIIGEAVMVENSQRGERVKHQEKSPSASRHIKDKEDAAALKDIDRIEGNQNDETIKSSYARYDNKKAATNVSLYLSLTALSSLISSYFGGKLLDFMSTQQMFMLTSVFSILTFVSGMIVYESKLVKLNDTLNQDLPLRQPMCQLAKKNWSKVWQYLRLPFIYLPIIFIFLVVLAPGVDDAMFYYQTNVLHFDNDQMGIINTINSLGNILGVWTYRLFFRNVSFKKMLFVTTTCFALAQGSKLLLTEQVTQYLGMSPLVYTYITSWAYTFVNELHLMPLMVLACKMCPKSVEASFYAFVLAVINLGYLVSYQLGGLLTWLLGITSSNFDNLWILILIASAFPMVTLLFLILIPSKYDVNEEIEKYFRMKKHQQKINATTSTSGIISSVSVKGKTNIRDEIDEEEILTDKLLIEDQEEDDDDGIFKSRRSQQYVDDDQQNSTKNL